MVNWTDLKKNSLTNPEKCPDSGPVLQGWDFGKQFDLQRDASDRRRALLSLEMSTGRWPYGILLLEFAFKRGELHSCGKRMPGFR